MLGRLRHAASAAKDAAVEHAALPFINARLAPLGVLRRLRIDSQAKTITAELDLKGEQEPIRVCVRDYRLTQEGDKTYLQAGRVEVSREWLSVLAAQLIPSQRLEVPAALKLAL